jgi:hypothetical protein
MYVTLHFCSNYLLIVLSLDAIRSVCELFGQISRISSSHQNQEKSTYQYMSANSFRGTAQQNIDLNPLDFYLWGHF